MATKKRVATKSGTKKKTVAKKTTAKKTAAKKTTTKKTTTKSPKAQLKTHKTGSDVEKFLAGIADKTQREDAQKIVAMMSAVTKAKPRMWGSSIIGFGDYVYTYPSGRSGDWFYVGMSPRKQNTSLYIMDGFDAYEGMLEKLGPHKTGKSCLYIKRLSDVDEGVLRKLVAASVKHMKKKHGAS